MSLAPHRTPSTSSSTFSPVPSLQRLLTSGISCADPRERGRDGHTLVQNLSQVMTDRRHHDSNKRDHHSKQNEHETVDTNVTKNISERTRLRARHREERCIKAFDDESSLDSKRAQTAWLPQVHHLVACEVEHAVLVPLVLTQTVEVVLPATKTTLNRM